MKQLCRSNSVLFTKAQLVSKTLRDMRMSSSCMKCRKAVRKYKINLTQVNQAKVFTNIVAIHKLFNQSDLLISQSKQRAN